MSRFSFTQAVSATWAVTLIAGTASAEQIVLRTMVGTTSGQRLGSQMDGGRDVDGDGVADLIVADSSDFAGVRVRVFSGSTGVVIHDIGPTASDESFGVAVALLGDQDGDGRSEFAIGSPRARVSGLIVGKIRIHSGATGAVLRTFAGAADGDRVGTVLVGGGDLDGDSVPDLIGGDPDAAPNGPASGRVTLYSGSTGNVISIHTGAQGDDLGWSLAAVGDQDGDGWNDYAAGAPYGATPIGADTGYVRIVSARTGATIRQITGFANGGLFGASMALVGDAEGDGSPELLVGEPGSDTLAIDCGRVHAVSPSSGNVLWSLAPTAEARARFGQSIVALSDIDGDGVSDAAVGSPDEDVLGTNGDAGRTRVLSTATGTVFETFSGTQASSFSGVLAPAGDVDGDGRLDFAIGAPSWDSTAFDGGQVRVVAGRFCEVSTFCASLPNSSGQAATLSVVGSLSVAANHMILRATGVPTHTIGTFYYGPSTAFVPFGNGIRCIGGDVHRLGVSAANAGVLEYMPDLAHPSTPSGAIGPGSAWYFQAWFRDAAPSAAPYHFNLSNGVRIAVCP